MLSEIWARALVLGYALLDTVCFQNCAERPLESPLKRRDRVQFRISLSVSQFGRCVVRDCEKLTWEALRPITPRRCVGLNKSETEAQLPTSPRKRTSSTMRWVGDHNVLKCLLSPNLSGFYRVYSIMFGPMCKIFKLSLPYRQRDPRRSRSCHDGELLPQGETP